MDSIAQSESRDALAAVKSLMDFPPFDRAHTAVVVIDMVNNQLTRGEMMMAELEANNRDVDYFLERSERLVVPNLQVLLRAARRAGIKVAYVRGGAGLPDGSDAIPAAQQAFRNWGAVDGSFSSDVIDALRPERGDLSLIKLGSGAFSSHLDAHLRNMGIDTLIYTGVATSGCVLVSVAAGFDLGYRGYLVADATATSSEYFQQAAEDIIGSYMARVVDTNDVIAAIEAAMTTPVPTKSADSAGVSPQSVAPSP